MLRSIYWIKKHQVFFLNGEKSAIVFYEAIF